MAEDSFETVGLGLVLDMKDSGAAAIDELLDKIDTLKASLRSITDLSRSALTLHANDEATPIVDEVRDKVQNLKDLGDNPIPIKADNEASPVFDEVTAKARDLKSLGDNPIPVRATDEATSIFDRVRSAATGLVEQAKGIAAIPVKAEDDATPIFDRVRGAAAGLASIAHSLTTIPVKAEDDASPVLERVKNNVQQLADDAHKAENIAVRIRDDGASSVLAEITSKVKELLGDSEKLQSINVRVKDEASGQINQVRTSFRSATQAAEEHGAVGSRVLDEVGGAAMAVAPMVAGMGAGFAAAFGGKEVIDAADNWEKSLLQIQANTGITDQQTQQLGQSVRQMGRESGASLDGLAQGYMHAINLGFSLDDANKIVRQGMMAAVSTGADVGATVQNLARVTKEWGLSGDQAATAMNELRVAGEHGDVVLQNLIDHGGKMMSTAAALHVPLQDVGAAFSALTDHGMDAAQAATQMTGILTHIVSPSKAAQGAIEQLSKATGVDLVGDFARFRAGSGDLTGVLQDMQKATTGNNAAIMDMIPALRGGQGALVLAGTGAEDMDTIFSALSDTIAGKVTPTQDAYNRYLESFAGQQARASEAVQELGIDLGSVFLPILASAAEGVANAIDGMRNWADTHQAVIDKISQIASAIGGVLMSNLQAFTQGLKDLGSALEPVAEAIMSKLGPALQAMGQWLQQHPALLKALETALTALISPVTAAGSAIEQFANYLKTGAGPLKDFFDMLGKVAGMLKDELKPSLDALKSIWDTLNSQISTNTELWAELGQIWQMIEPLVQGLATIIGAVLVVALQALIVVLNTTLAAIAGALPGALQALGGIIQMVTGIIKLFEDEIRGMGQVANDVIHGNFAQAWEDAKTMVSNMAADVQQIVSGMMQGISGIISAAAGGILATVRTFTSNVISEFQKMRSVISGNTIVRDMMDEVNDLMDKGGRRATATTKQFTSDIVQVIQNASGDVANAVSQLFSTGNVDQGLITGVDQMASAVVDTHQRMATGAANAVRTMVNNVDSYTREANSALTEGNSQMADAYLAAADLVRQGAENEAKDVVAAAKAIEAAQHGAAQSTLTSMREVIAAKKDEASLSKDLDKLMGDDTVTSLHEVTQATVDADHNSAESARSTAIDRFNAFKAANDQLIQLEQQLAGTEKGPDQDALKQQIEDLKGFVADAKASFTDVYGEWQTDTKQAGDDAKKLADDAKKNFDDMSAAWKSLNSTVTADSQLTGGVVGAAYAKIKSDATTAYADLQQQEQNYANATDAIAQKNAADWIEYDKKKLADDASTTSKMLSDNKTAAADATAEYGKLQKLLADGAKIGDSKNNPFAAQFQGVRDDALNTYNDLKARLDQLTAATTDADRTNAQEWIDYDKHRLEDDGTTTSKLISDANTLASATKSAYSEMLSAWGDYTKIVDEGSTITGTKYSAQYQKIVQDAKDATLQIKNLEAELARTTDEATRNMLESWIAYQKQRITDDQTATETILTNIKTAQDAANAAMAKTTQAVKTLGTTTVSAATTGAAAMTTLSQKVGDVGTSAEAAAKQMAALQSSIQSAASSVTSNGPAGPPPNASQQLAILRSLILGDQLHGVTPDPQWQQQIDQILATGRGIPPNVTPSPGSIASPSSGSSSGSSSVQSPSSTSVGAGGLQVNITIGGNVVGVDSFQEIISNAVFKAINRQLPTAVVAGA